MLARELAHPFSLAYGLWVASYVSMFRGEARLPRNTPRKASHSPASAALRSGRRTSWGCEAGRWQPRANAPPAGQSSAGV